MTSVASLQCDICILGEKRLCISYKRDHRSQTLANGPNLAQHKIIFSPTINYIWPIRPIQNHYKKCWPASVSQHM